MANVCEITGKRKLKGNRVSHANNKTIHFQQPNIRDQRIFIPELGRTVRIKVSTSALRSIDKHGGLSRYILKAKPANLSANMLKLKKEIIKKGLN
ncbi:MAG: 50S ribosomal protein L28 [Deltaproteobacteria bacterium]|nr:50S ribosomal protein L28 [Deltaproteobacteria bacterium]